MLDKLRRLIPTREQLEHNRWLRWLGPGLLHPMLWRCSRRGIAIGVGIGMFFGLLTPIAQIPFAAGAAVLLRANVPAAVSATLVTNPITFAPIYVVAHRIGSAILGESSAETTTRAVIQVDTEQTASWWETARRQLISVGKPLLLGLAVLATISGVLTYWGILLVWRLRTAWRWTRRRARGSNSS